HALQMLQLSPFSSNSLFSAECYLQLELAVWDVCYKSHCSVSYLELQVTMSHEVSWRVFLLLSLSSFSYSQNCKWLQPHQERLNQRILQNFNLMSPVEEFPLACILNTTFPPNIDALYSVSQVGAAALAVREVTNQTNWFYIKHHESLRCQQQAWERLQALLHYQGNQLAECIPEGAENHLHKEAASKYFHTLEEIVQEQDNNVCARNIIRMEVGRNLRLAAQLSSRMGRGRREG
ncbi:uncharacterized protein LOC142475468, partial [Ascaphus truei]|uniref:uncharacterized protein LOC142475468 n=1 Tax=Ascaphus truei TaxID=8439 RepID=UPI003F5A7B02